MTDTSTDRYHHGDLRRALLDAARAIITTEDVQRLTLRAVARRAGVSHAAPYHHFADKAALIAALVADYFGQMATVMYTEAAASSGTAGDKLVALGRAYVRFALEHPAIFRLMFRPELWHSSQPQEAAIVFRLIQRTPPFATTDKATDAPVVDPEMLGLEAYEVARDIIIAGQKAGQIVPGDPEPLALTCWATVHGLAMLLLDRLSDQVPPAEIAAYEQLATTVAATMIDGIRRSSS